MMGLNIRRLFTVAVVVALVVSIFSMSSAFARNKSNDDDSNSGTTHASGYHSWNHDDDSSSGHKHKKKPKKEWLTDGNKNIDHDKHFLGTTDEADLVIKTDDTEKMRVTTEGDVGIGTDSPTGTLHVEGGEAAADTDGKDVTIKAQDGGPIIGTGGNIVLTPGNDGDGTPSGTVYVGEIDSLDPPTLTLDINGQIRIRGGSPFIGAVLTSDSFGNASWMSVNLNETDPTVDLDKLKALVTDDFHNLGGIDADTHIDKAGIEVLGFVDGPHTVDTTLDQVDIETLGFVTGAHTLDTDTNIDKPGIEVLGFVDGPHTVDTTLDQTGVETLGFVTGAHTIDTDTNIDKLGIEAIGFVDGPHTVDTTLDQAGVEGLGFVTGAHTIDTDTNIDKVGIETLGFVDGAHTVDTTLDLAGVEGLGFVTGAHTVDTDTNIDKPGIEALGFVDGAHTVDTTLDQTGVETLGFVTGAHTIDTDTNIDKLGIEAIGFVDGAHTVDTDTNIDKPGIEALGFVDGAHTVDTTLDQAGVEGLGFVTGAHTVDTDTNIDKPGIQALGFVDGAHTVDTTLNQAGVEGLGFVTGAHTVESDPTVDLPKLKSLVTDDFHNLGGVDQVDDADTDPENELNTSVILNGTNLEVTDAGGTIATDLSSLGSEVDPEVGANTTNFMPKWDGSSLVTGTIFDDGNVGIGTVTPGAKLNISHGANQWLQFKPYLTISNKLVSSGGLGFAVMEDENNIPLDIDGTTGNVGIGTSSPETKLHVNGFGGGSGSIKIENAGEADINYVDTTGTGQNWQVGTNSLGFYIYDSTYRMVVEKTNGNVGIGTTNPGAKLEVAGQVKITGGNPGLGKVLTSDALGLAAWEDTAGFGFFSDGGEAGTAERTLGNTDNFDLGFLTNNLTRLHIQNDGNVGIGTTSPGNKLDVVGGSIATDSYLKINSWDTFGTGYGRLWYDGAEGSGSSTGYLGIGADAVDQLVIQNGGNVGIGTAAPGGKLVVSNMIGSEPLLQVGSSSASYGTGIGHNTSPLSNKVLRIGHEGTSVDTLLLVDGTRGGPAGGAVGLVVKGKSDQSADLMQWQNSSAGILGVIDSSGNVGIGTATPGQKLTVDGMMGILESGTAPTFHTIFQGGDQSADIAYTLPTDQGGADTVLANNGSGFLSWEEVTSGLWTESGSNVYYDTGNVGIGTTTPRTPLEVSGSFRAGQATGTQWDAANVGSNSIAMGVNTTASGFRSTAMGRETTASGFRSTAMGHLTTAQAFASTVLGRYNRISGDTTNWVDSDPLFAIGNGTSTNRSNAMTVLKNGNVGIGTISPGGLLGLKDTNTYLDVDGTNNLTFTDSVTGTKTLAQLASGSSLWTDAGTYINANNAANVVVSDTGNVGIGTTTPGANLDIAGNIKIADGTQGTGKVLTSIDVTGLAAWADAPSGGDFANSGEVGTADRTLGNTDNFDLGFLTNNLTRLHIQNDGNVGIGTSSPSYKFNVAGTAPPAGLIRLGSTDYATNVILSVAPGTVYYDAPNIVGGRMTIDGSSGNVGIGTPAPSTKLDIDGQIRIRGGGAVAGSVLTSDANGVATWELFANDGDWTISGDDIHSALSGNVGIGTATPGQKLTVDGMMGILEGGLSPSFHTIFQGGDQSADIAYTLPTDQGGADTVLTNDGSGILSWGAVTSGLWTESGSHAHYNSGNVGIGTATPETKLHINGHGGGSGSIKIENAGEADINFVDTSSTGQNWQVGTSALGFYMYNTDYRMVVQKGGNVGIGTQNPGSKLVVAGQVQITGGTPVANEVLTSDANGVATWEPIADDGDWTISGNDIHSALSGNVGIGTTTPGQKLTVDGMMGILEGGANPTFHTIFQGGDQSADIAYTLPTDQGGADTVLTNDGSGILSWGAVTSSLWTDAGTYINANNAANVVVSDTGRVGIGTTSPDSPLTFGATTGNKIELFDGNGYGMGVENFELRVNTGSGSGRITFYKGGHNGTEMMTINNGNVGIGIPSPGEKLEVAGNIKVTGGSFIDDGTTLNVPDYVFEEGYPLMPLDELREFINYEKHLPNVPSVNDVKDRGVNISQLQMRLLEKIEELTLHTLSQQEEIEQLKIENGQLKGAITTLADRQEAIENMLLVLSTDLPKEKLAHLDAQKSMK